MIIFQLFQTGKYMSCCKWCNKKGFLLNLSVNGLCEECNPVAVKKIHDNGEIIQKSIDELDFINLSPEGLKIIREIKNSLNLLKQYEVKGIPTISPLPSELINKNIYGSMRESLNQIETRLNEENNKFIKGVLTLDCELCGDNPRILKGEFKYDNYLKSFVQFCKSPPHPELNQGRNYNKMSIEFTEDYSSGIYREYYLSNKLRMEVYFIKDNARKALSADGIERIYYEGLNSSGEETYTIVEENFYKKAIKCGIAKRYSIDGGLMEIVDYDSEILTPHGLFSGHNRSEFYPETGSLKLEEHKDWGKEYYLNHSIKAEWKNKDYERGDYIEYHENGKVKMRCNYLDGINRDGLMYKYFDDGKIKELWSYNKGKRIFVKKYFPSGVLKTEWLYDVKGKEISKIYYTESGKEQKK